MVFVICLCGPDGSGKSTIAIRLVLHFRMRHRCIRVIWLRGTHTFASVLARFLRTFSIFSGSCNPYYNICIPRGMKGLWIWIELLSILPVILMRLVIPRLLGCVIIAERCLIDFLIWLIITLKLSNVHSLVLSIILTLSKSLCSYTIYIRANENVLLYRRRNTTERYLIPIELRIYDKVTQILNVPHVDTTNKFVHESVREILEIIGRCHG